MRIWLCLMPLVPLVFASDAFAGCELSSFDKTSPAKFAERVENGFASFEWGTDADPYEAAIRIWNYVKNSDSGSELAFRWDKAGMTAPISNPLPAGATVCQRFFVRKLSSSPDFDAPIIYGTSNQVQMATVYTSNDKVEESKEGVASTSSFASSAIIDDVVRQVTVELVSQRTESGASFSIRYSPGGMIIGFSKLPEILENNDIGNIGDGDTYESFVSSPVDVMMKGAYELMSPEEAGSRFLFLSSLISDSSVPISSKIVKLYSVNVVLSTVDLVLSTRSGKPIGRARLSAYLSE